MSMFIQVFSYDKGCDVIINLDTVMEIAPLREGGCNLFFPDSASVGGKTSMRVKESYSLFKQFVLETVTQDRIAKQVAQLATVTKEDYPQTNLSPAPQPEPVAEAPRGRGRPPKSTVMGSSAIADKH